MKNLNRWSQVTFKTGLQIKNRVVVPPMASATATADGYVTSATLDHYERLSKSGAGIVFVEYTYIHRSGRGEENQLGIFSNHQIEGLAKLANKIIESGAVAGIQLVHCGAKSSSNLTGEPLWGASSISVPVKDQEMEKPREMSLEEIQKYQHWYVDATQRAVKAGFAIIEFHAAHGYGLNQWLSPITNQRTDSYGGSFENRSRMVTEILSQVRNKFPQVTFGLRIPGEDYHPAGISSDEMILLSQKLQDMGVDFLDISSGIGGWRRPSNREGEGYLVPEATRIQSQVQVPVIGVGGIKTGPFIDQSIADHHFTFAAVGRAVLENPQAFYQNVLQKTGLNHGHIGPENYKIAQ